MMRLGQIKKVRIIRYTELESFIRGYFNLKDYRVLINLSGPAHNDTCILFDHVFIDEIIEEEENEEKNPNNRSVEYYIAKLIKNKVIDDTQVIIELSW